MTDAEAILYGVLVAVLACVGVLLWLRFEFRRGRAKRIDDLNRWTNISHLRTKAYEARLELERLKIKSLRKNGAGAEELHDAFFIYMSVKQRIDEESSSRARMKWELEFFQAPTVSELDWGHYPHVVD